MKIFISVDMEGIAGIVHNYEEFNERAAFRGFLLDQLRWVIEGIKASPANKQVTQITVCDSHGDGRSLPYSDLSAMDDRIVSITGSPRPQYMVCGLDSSYTHVFFIGYHAGAGTIHGNMEHTFYSKVVHRMYVNNVEMNESTLNGIHCAQLGVPVALIVGDDTLKKQLDTLGLLNDVPYVTTKFSITRYAAQYQRRSELQRETLEQVGKALKYAGSSQVQLKKPFKLKLEYHKSLMADIGEQVPGAKRLDGYTVAMTLSDSATLLNAVSTLCRLGATVD